MATLRPKEKETGSALEEVEEKFQKETANMEEIKKQRNWYAKQKENLKSLDLTLEDLENDKLWENSEKAIEFNGDRFQEQTNSQRRIEYEEQLLANEFRQARITEIAKRKLDKLVDEVIATPPTTEEKMAKLTDAQHRALFKKLMKD